MNRPTPTTGMRHIALYAENFEECEKFYVDLMGMQIEWRPDPDNVYLTSGNDNLALHRAEQKAEGPQRLDHIGFFLAKPEHVDEWYEFLVDNNVEMRTKVKQHRDGAKSFYCYDPDKNVVQIIFHPPLA